MSLIKKLKEIPKVLMLSAAIASAAGCVTTTPWQVIKTEQKPTGVERTAIENTGSKTIKEREFNISDAYMENEAYKMKITESAKNATYALQIRYLKKEVQKFDVEQKKEETEIFGPIILGLGTVGGIYAGAQLSDKNWKLAGGLLGGLIGFIGSVLIGGALHIPPVTKTETRQNNLGKEEIYAGRNIEENLSGRKLVYSNQPARNVRFGKAGNSTTYLTDSNGTFSVAYNEKNEAITREGLERKLYDIPIVQQIKPGTRERLRERLLDAISKATGEITIETREQPANELEIVNNASKKFILNYFKLEDGAVYRIVGQFVDEEINPSIISLKFRVKDDLTHVPIENSNFEFATKVPSKSELAGKYFTGELMNYAEKVIKDYLIGNSRIGNLSDEFELKVYSPSNLSVEVTNPDYNFVSGQIAIKGDMQKTVYMIDKGSKIRIAPEKESVGRIE